MEDIKAKLKELQDKIYELEGLVHLSLIREDRQEEILKLICRKGKHIFELSSELSDEEQEDHENYIAPLDDLSYSLEEKEPEPRVKEENNPEISDSEEMQVYVHEEEGEKEVENIPEEPVKNEDEGNKSRGKLVFSITDRFRFRQALFDNSDVDFNNTLALVASMEDYEEAEDYFLNEQGWNQNDRTVKSFLNILKNYFR